MTENIGLRKRLIGGWTLRSYVETNTATGEEHHPLGPSPRGFILYTPDGYMSAQLRAADRPSFAGGDMYRGTEAEYPASGSSYLAYSGRFFVDEERGMLSHEMAVSLFPNWQGQTQIRLVSVDRDDFRLSTDGPQRFNGALKLASLTWRRAAPNP